MGGCCHPPGRGLIEYLALVRDRGEVTIESRLAIRGDDNEFVISVISITDFALD